MADSSQVSLQVSRSQASPVPSTVTPAAGSARSRATGSAFPSDRERLASFARALDDLRKEVEAQVGEPDLAHMRRIRKLSRRAEIAGRALLQVGFDPVTLGAGVGCLWLHKTLELMEIGHNVLHGCLDDVPGDHDFHTRGFAWKAPIDERSWVQAHNLRHHRYTNVAGRDPDLDFGGLRLSPRIAHRAVHRLQPVSNFVSWLGFANAINLHVTGMLDVYLKKSEPPMLRDHGWPSIRDAHKAFLGKFARYYGRELGLFPALAGPFFLKVAAGNMLSEVLRDVWAGAVIYCGHVGADDYPSDTRSDGAASWYVMQVEAAINIDGPEFVSVLCGGLDKQIEHHLFPRLPPNRLREIAPRVRAICEQHGVRYRSAPLPRRIVDVVRVLRELASPRAVS
jgi:NADPH-dependent stearoyl-CoA 9-desaturase